jgi:hypothetical protein
MSFSAPKQAGSEELTKLIEQSPSAFSGSTAAVLRREDRTRCSPMRGELTGSRTE